MDSPAQRAAQPDAGSVGPAADGAGPGSRSDRFLVAFARAEDALKQLLGTESRESFRWLVRHVAKRNAQVAAVEDDLIEYSHLRNAIVHERGGGYVIAEPHLSTVEHLERIVEMIVDPPRVERCMSRPVITCGPDDPIALAAKHMVRGDFSRLPVYAEGELLGLLTANAVARWIAARLDDSLHALHDEPVRTVMGYGDAARRYVLVSRDHLVADVIGLFTAAHVAGRRLEAILITETGAATEPPLGIVTIQDLPHLYGMVEARGGNSAALHARRRHESRPQSGRAGRRGGAPGHGST